MEGGKGLESSVINPLKLCSQHFEKVYVLLWITVMVTNTSAQRVCDRSVSSRQCFTRTIQSNNPYILKVKGMRKTKRKTLDKDKPCDKFCPRFFYCVLWLCCLMKQTFLVLSIPSCVVIWSFNSSWTECSGVKSWGKGLGTKYWSKSVLHVQKEQQGSHQPVSKTLMMALHHPCASGFWNILGKEGCKTALCNFDLWLRTCSLWLVCWLGFNPGAVSSLLICAFIGVLLATACERAAE